MTRLGAFVMTFDRPEILHETLETLRRQTRPPETILVLDNGDTPETPRVVSRFEGGAVQHVCLGGNRGPAGAAAHGLERLVREGYDWIYWGDDDDPPYTADTLERLLDLATSHGEEVAGVGAAGTRWDWRCGRTERFPDEALSGVLDVDVIAGSSQLMLGAHAVRAVGLPEAELFFGFEEPAYCLRLRRAGYRLLIDGELLREYRLAAGRLGLRRVRSPRPRHEYSSIWRQYYSTRNYIYTMRCAFDRPDLARREVVKACVRVLGSWSRGARYGARFTHLQLRGVLDGYAGRLGCTVSPRSKHSRQAGTSTPGGRG